MTDGKVAVVTGATSGIGRATAIGLGKAGYRVAILGRREVELAETARLSGARYSGTCDVTDPAAVHRYFTDLKAKLGRVDVVFNNAGRFAPQASFGDTDIGTWQGMVDVNLNGAFYVAREAFRAMRDQSPQGGRMRGIASLAMRDRSEATGDCRHKNSPPAEVHNLPPDFHRPRPSRKHRLPFSQRSSTWFTRGRYKASSLPSPS